MTVHKSQASTYHTVILDVKDAMKDRDTKERQRLLYTAVTRASNNLILYV